MPDGAEQDAAFLKAYEQSPNHPWLAWAASGVLYRQGERERAYQAMKTSYEGPQGAQDSHLVLMARVARSLNRMADVAQFASKSRTLRSILDVEMGAKGVAGSPMEAYKELARGNLTRALQIAGQDEAVGPRVLRLGAASASADPKTVERALALGSEQGIDPGTILPSIALLRKHERDASDYTLRMSDMFGESASRLLAFTEPPAAAALKKRKVFIKHVEDSLVGLDPWARGQALAASAVFLDDDVPVTWAREVEALLFSTERPNLRH